MPRRLPPYVDREKTRHGRWLFYFRRGKGRRVRLPDDPTAPEFHEAYQAALTGNAPAAKHERASSKSLRWLVDRYRESAAWRQYSVKTRRQYELFLLQAIERSHNAPFFAITRADVQRAVDARADRTAYARNFLKAMRSLFAWATRNGHVEIDPTLGVERPKHRTQGFPAWTPDDVLAFREHHAIGTRARLAMELLLLTGLRRSDLVRIGRQHLQGDTLSIRTAKTDAVVTVKLPPALLDVLAATPAEGLNFVSTECGAPFSVDGFGNWFREQCRAAGVSKSAHGLRKLSATLAAEGGAAAHELMAQYGWSKIEQAAIYTRAADRARLGIRASKIVADQIENKILRTLVPGAGNRQNNPVKSDS